MPVTMLPSGGAAASAARRRPVPAAGRTTTPAAGRTTTPAAGRTTTPATGRTTIPAAGRTTALRAGRTTALGAGRTTPRAAGQQAPAAAAWPALGTTATVAVTDPMRLPEARALLAAELAAVDAACSTFREDSELVAVNAAARSQHRPVSISPLLADAIGAALRAAEQTGGDVDPVAGRAISAVRGGRRVTCTTPRGTHLRLTVATGVGWRHVRLDQENGLLALPPGSWLDLGATAKAWAADRAAAAIAARLGCGVLISLGGDVAACGDAPRGGWRIRVQDKAGPVVSIRRGGLATAGPGSVRWRHGGDVLAHILSPQSAALAASPWRIASVTAASCAEARAACTAAIIRGSAAISWLTDAGLPARLVDTAGRAHAIAGWPSDTSGTSSLADTPSTPGTPGMPGPAAAAGPGPGTSRAAGRTEAR